MTVLDGSDFGLDTSICNLLSVDADFSAYHLFPFHLDARNDMEGGDDEVPIQLQAVHAGLVNCVWSGAYSGREGRLSGHVTRVSRQRFRDAFIDYSAFPNSRSASEMHPSRICNPLSASSLVRDSGG